MSILCRKIKLIAANGPWLGVQSQVQGLLSLGQIDFWIITQDHSCTFRFYGEQQERLSCLQNVAFLGSKNQENLQPHLKMVPSDRTAG